LILLSGQRLFRTLGQLSLRGHMIVLNKIDVLPIWSSIEPAFLAP
jgi:hypothetical protein